MTGRPVSAKYYDAFLRKKGFNLVNYNTPIKGDIAVFQPYTGGSIHGHIQMFDGSNWISDFKQNSFWPGSGYRKFKPSFTIFRW